MCKQSTVCFSGYRPEKFSFPLDTAHPHFVSLQMQISHAITQAIHDGYTVFLCGMAKGFDLTCADILLDIRESHPRYSSVQLVCVLPYQGHGSSGSWGNLHRIVRNCANRVETISDRYTTGCMQRRNRYMVEQSSRLICYWDGQTGGTMQTVHLAKQKGLQVINVSENNFVVESAVFQEQI